MKNLMIVESDPITLHAVVGMLKGQAGFITVYSASNGRKALDILATQPIDLVIAGLHLPEIANFELMAKLEKHFPQIRIIVMTNGASPMMRAKVKQMATAIPFDQALDLSLLVQRIFSELNIQYGGRIHGVSLPSFLQMLEMEYRSCTLMISAKGRTGYLYIHKGKPISAQLGKLTGRLAALQILTWTNVTIDIDYAQPSVRKDITKPLMNLIMESGRLIDEAHRQKPNLRKFERFECIVPVDYDLSEWTYHSCMLDVSQGGAYMTTEQQIRVGESIIVSLSSTDILRSGSINGQVIRRDPHGMGVKFEDLNIQQLKLLDHIRTKYFSMPSISQAP